MAKKYLCCSHPSNCQDCLYLKGKEINPIEINSLQTNINQYNRYPFENKEEAILQMKKKRLLPGEMAIGYYYESNDEGKLTGINCIIGIGNLKNNDNIIKW